MNTSTHIKTPILSRIVTKPTKWQVHPAKAQSSMGGSSYPRGARTGSFTELLSSGANRSNYPSRLTGSFVRLLGWDIMWHYGRLFWARLGEVMFLYWSKFYSIMTLIVKMQLTVYANPLKVLSANRQSIKRNRYYIKDWVPLVSFRVITGVERCLIIASSLLTSWSKQ